MVFPETWLQEQSVEVPGKTNAEVAADVWLIVSAHTACSSSTTEPPVTLQSNEETAALGLDIPDVRGTHS